MLLLLFGFNLSHAIAAVPCAVRAHPPSSALSNAQTHAAMAGAAILMDWLSNVNAAVQNNDGLWPLPPALLR